MSAEIIEEMKRVGFTGVEAQIYVFLLQHPLSTGYEVSKGVGLARANVYQALESLLVKERVTAVSDEPVRYAAAPAERLLGRIREETEQRCRTLSTQLASLSRPDSVGHFWEISERSRIEARLSSLIGAARRRIAASLWAEDLDKLADDLKAARERGCLIVLNLFGEARADFAEVYRHEEPENVVGGHFVALSIDYEEALIASLDGLPTGVVTQNRTLVHLVEKLIRDEAYLAAIYARFPLELEEEFGPHLVELRRRLLPTAAAQKLVAVTALGTRPVTLPEGLAG